MQDFPRIPLAVLSTSIQKLENISRLLNTNVYIKRDDLTGIGLGGNKVRKLEFLLADAKRKGAEVVFTTGGAQSNHAMLTAACAKKLGMEPILILKCAALPSARATSCWNISWIRMCASWIPTAMMISMRRWIVSARPAARSIIRSPAAAPTPAWSWSAFSTAEKARHPIMREISYKSPFYIQLRKVIRSKIEEEYLPGTAIPSENQLMETYGLNRVSVRSALAALEFEGLLKSVKGKGVFVAGPKAKRNMDTLSGFHNTMRQSGGNTATRILSKTLRQAGPYYARLLEISPESTIWFIRRVENTAGEPVALEELYIPYSVVPGLEEVDIKLFSIYDIYQWNGIVLGEGHQTLRITRLSPMLAKHMDVPPEQAVMEFSCTTRDRGGRVVEFSRSYVRNDKAEFVVHFRHTNP